MGSDPLKIHPSQWGMVWRDSLRRSLEIEGHGSGWIEIGWRRLFILPTRSGWVLIATTLLLLVGSMNFDSVLGFILSFLVAGILLSSLYLANRNLLGLRLQPLGAEPAHVGHSVTLEFNLYNAAGIRRHEIRVSRAEYRSAPVDLDAGAQGFLSLSLPALRRGRVNQYTIHLESRYPASLFRSFVRLRLSRSLVIWPEPVGSERPPRPESTLDPGGGGRTSELVSIQQDDFHGLREFRRGDSPRHVAWPRFAHDGQLMVKTFVDELPDIQWLDWEKLPVGDPEYRLSTLCRAALDLADRGVRFGLRLPGHRVDPGLGRAHLVLVLNALSEFGDAAGEIG